MKRNSWAISDLIIPILAIILAFYYLYTIKNIPIMAKAYGGSLSIIVIILGAIIFGLAAYNGVFRKVSNPITYIKNNWNTLTLLNYRKVIILLLLIFLFIVLIPYIGYPLTSIIFISAVMYVLGMRKKRRIIGIATLVTFIGFSLFVLFLNVPFPLDLFTSKIKYLIR